MNPVFKILVRTLGPLFGAAYAAPNKDTTIYTDLDLKNSVNPLANGKIQGPFKAFE